MNGIVPPSARVINEKLAKGCLHAGPKKDISRRSRRYDLSGRECTSPAPASLPPADAATAT